MKPKKNGDQNDRRFCLLATNWQRGIAA